MPKSKPQSPLTKKRFEALLTKAAQPLPKKESVLKETETSVVPRGDGYTETRKNQDNPEGKKD